MSCHWDVVVTASLGGSVSVSLGVVGRVFISLCSYDKVGTLSLVWITANSGDRLGETVQNIFCLRSSFQYLSNDPSVEVSFSYTEAASSSWTASWSREGCRIGVTSGRGSGSGCQHPCSVCVCWLVYSLLKDLWIVGELGLTVGSWNVIRDIGVGVALPVCMTAVSGSFMNHCFWSRGG